MNRRELFSGAFKALAVAAAAKGIDGQMSALEPAPVPLAFVLTSDRPLTDSQRTYLRTQWEATFKGKPPAPLIVLPFGMTIEAITEPRGEGS